MRIYRTSLYATRIIIDLLIVTWVFLISGNMSFPRFYIMSTPNAKFLLLTTIITWLISAKSSELYDEFRSRNVNFEIIAVVKNVMVEFMVIIVMLFFLREEEFSRYFIVIFSSLSVFVLSVEKITVRYLLNTLRNKGRNIRNVLIVGAGEVGRNFSEAIVRNAHFGYKLFGFLDDKSKNFLNGKYLGKIDDLDAVLNKQVVDDVIIALPNYAINRIVEVTSCVNYSKRI